MDVIAKEDVPAKPRVVLSDYILRSQQLGQFPYVSSTNQWRFRRLFGVVPHSISGVDNYDVRRDLGASATYINNPLILKSSSWVEDPINVQLA